jgi:hypothetical protein
MPGTLLELLAPTCVVVVVIIIIIEFNEINITYCPWGRLHPSSMSVDVVLTDTIRGVATVLPGQFIPHLHDAVYTVARCCFH